MQRPVVVVGGVAQLVYGGRVRRAVSGRRGRRGGGRGIGCRWRCLRVGGRWLWGGGGALEMKVRGGRYGVKVEEGGEYVVRWMVVRFWLGLQWSDLGRVCVESVGSSSSCVRMESRDEAVLLSKIQYL